LPLNYQEELKDKLRIATTLILKRESKPTEVLVKPTPAAPETHLMTQALFHPLLPKRMLLLTTDKNLISTYQTDAL
jgi:hypothetical protein